MTSSWSSLYLRSDDADAVAAALRDLLTSAGFRLFDPFGSLPGPAYARTVRLFVAPAAGGWVRVIGALTPALLAALSGRLGVCLAASLDRDQADISLFDAGAQQPDLTRLIPYLRPGRKLDDLQAAWAAAAPPSLPASAGGLPVQALPDDVRTLLDRVDARQAQALFARLSGGLLRKVGAGDAAEAASALAGGAPDWESGGGRRLRAFMACLTLPESWREPDFTAVRDAYALARRRQRSPQARLYPGDAEALARVPDALSYIPVYGGAD